MKKLLLFILLVTGFLTEVPAYSGVSKNQEAVVSQPQNSEKLPEEIIFSPRTGSLQVIHVSPSVSVLVPNLSSQNAFLIYSHFLRLRVQAILASQRSGESHSSDKRYLFDNYPSHNFW